MRLFAFLLTLGTLPLSSALHTPDASAPKDEFQLQLERELKELMFEVKDLREEVKLLRDDQKSLQLKHDTTIGFTVSINEDYKTEAGQKINYPSVLSNVGGGYIPARSEFLAPVKGTYVFNVNLRLAVDKPAICTLQLWKNDAVLGIAYAPYLDNFRPLGSNMFVVELAQGDSVYVTGTTDNCWLAFASTFTNFSGFYIGS